MILIGRRVVLEDTTYRVAEAWALAFERLWALRGERDDQLVRGADAQQAD
jgi:hypothetical protein